MKIHGVKVHQPNVEIVVIPRGEEVIVFRCQAVLSMDEFTKLCPPPQPREILKPGGKRVFDVEDEGYKLELKQYGERRFAYLCLKSLEATEGLEWETVRLGDPDTWLNHERELGDSGFTYNEIQRIQEGVLSANCLNETKLEEARKRFLAGQAVVFGAPSSRTVAQNTTPSGELVNDSASDPQD
jgi:hypothetical protein